MSTQKRIPPKLFITGTDTGIGKTIVSSILVTGLNAAYWKPVQSGLSEETDTEIVKRLSGLPSRHFFPETYRLKEPLSPHASSKIEGIDIKLENFRLPVIGSSFKNLIVEGAGGILVPLNNREYILDLMVKLKIPVLLVARSTLGTINHTLQSIEIMRQKGIDIFGVVMNGPKNPSNKDAIEHFGNVNICAEIEPIENMSETSLMSIFNRNFHVQ